MSGSRLRNLGQSMSSTCQSLLRPGSTSASYARCAPSEEELHLCYKKVKKFYREATKEEKISACSNTKKIVQRMFELHGALKQVENIQKLCPSITTVNWIKHYPNMLTPKQVAHALVLKIAVLDENPIARRLYLQQEAAFAAAMHQFGTDAFGEENATTSCELKARRAQLEADLLALADVEAETDLWIVGNAAEAWTPAALTERIWGKLDTIKVKMNRSGRNLADDMFY